MSNKGNNKSAPQNYDELRAALILRGWTLRAWALAHKKAPSTVYGAARKDRAGVAAVRIRRQLIAAATAEIEEVASV